MVVRVFAYSFYASWEVTVCRTGTAHIWQWDARTKQAGNVAGKDIEAAEGTFRRVVRELLANG